MENYLFLIPLVPLISATIIGLSGNNLKRSVVNIMAPLAIFISFILSVSAFFTLKSKGAALSQTLFRWIDLPMLKINLAFYFDHLTAVMALVVTGVAFLIHVYSTGYMEHDESYSRYFAYLNLFTFFMIVLISAKNLPLMFIGWEGVGLCSYLLIGFWFKDIENSKAGKKAFIVNRIGDFGFLVGMIILGLEIKRATGVFNLDFVQMKGAVHFLGDPANVIKFMGVSMIAIAGASLFLGATGKSAQIPLYVWLPDAMAGPTPVSALIHAATMVTAGVYMIGRLNYIFLLIPNVMVLIAWIGGLTALFAATIAIAQTDIKKILAYSTISQLGYMFMAMGVGAFSAGIFHLATHAFFKGLLFLGAGAVIYAMHHEQNIFKMGALRDKIPITFAVFTAGWYAICALPFGAGFFSKDMIVHHAYTSANGGVLLFSVAIVTGGLTAFYMSRLYFVTFFGESRLDKHLDPRDIKEPPTAMLWPMGVLAILSLLGGFIPIPHFLDIFGEVKEAHEISAHMVGLISTIFVAGGIFVAWFLYIKKDSKVSSKKKNKADSRNIIQDVLFRGYYVDELYHSLFVKNTIFSGKFFEKWFDKGIIDNFFIHGTAKLTLYFGGIVSMMQTGRVSGYILSLITGTLLVLYFLLF